MEGKEQDAQQEQHPLAAHWTRLGDNSGPNPGQQSVWGGLDPPAAAASMAAMED